MCNDKSIINIILLMFIFQHNITQKIILYYAVFSIKISQKKRGCQKKNHVLYLGMINLYLCYICFNRVSGKEYKELQIGQVSMPTGTIQVAVSYRTSMTLTSQQDPIMLKSDHFRKEYSPRHNQKMIKTPMYVLLFYCYFNGY